MTRINFKEVIEKIDPSSLNYEEWLKIGFALKHEGYSVDVWDSWSRKDQNRYHEGECVRKWNSFSGEGVTGGTIIEIARNQGIYSFNTDYKEDKELEWDFVLSDEDNDYRFVDKDWIERREIDEPSDEKWNPVDDLIKYLSTLFQMDEFVSYVTETYDIVDDKTNEIIKKPTKGSNDRTAGQLIELLNKHRLSKDIGAVVGDYDPTAGAWIRFNPLNGKGVNNTDVIDFRYALVESDKMDIGKQNAILRELELPIAALVFSGKKSIHAIVKIEAKDKEEYKKRVEFLYKICRKNGLDVDTQNRNPSRLSRMPGIFRNGRKQFLIDTNIGKNSWEEWEEWIEDINDELPDLEGLESHWDNLPELAPPLIDGVLRQGHKMLLSGPSKAGKSFALIELSIAIAEGRKWLGWNCEQGKVLYINLELDRASCLHRFKDVYDVLKLSPINISNIDIWNLRGKSIPMDKLTPKLIRRSLKKEYKAIIIDPIYKVITGDENSADQMANFTNQFDKIATELNCSVIYCHHHSKGSQGGKRSMDRASGSGVFARDPDALIDLIELDVEEDIYTRLIEDTKRNICLSFLSHTKPNFRQEISQEEFLDYKALLKYTEENTTPSAWIKIQELIVQEAEKVRSMTGWRVSGTLREFKNFIPKNIWFKYPTHQEDTTHLLIDCLPEGEVPLFQSKGHKKKIEKAKKETNDKKQDGLEIAFSSLELEGKEDITLSDLAEELGVSTKTIKRRINDSDNFYIDRIDGKTSYVKRNN